MSEGLLTFRLAVVIGYVKQGSIDTLEKLLCVFSLLCLSGCFVIRKDGMTGLDGKPMQQILGWIESISLAQTGLSSLITTTVATTLMLMIRFLARPGRRTTPEQKLNVVTVYPVLGVQLSTEIAPTPCLSFMHPPNRQYQTFIPRDQIVDCIVYELVLSHKVKDVIAFRVASSKPTTFENEQFSSIKQSQQLTLIPAFPEAELTHQECLYFRREINLLLGLTS